jgi:hypothetical protein
VTSKKPSSSAAISTAYAGTVPFALGQRLFVHHIFGRGIVGLIAVVAIVLLMRFWPLIIRWWERR